MLQVITKTFLLPFLSIKIKKCKTLVFTSEDGLPSCRRSDGVSVIEICISNCGLEGEILLRKSLFFTWYNENRTYLVAASRILLWEIVRKR